MCIEINEVVTRLRDIPIRVIIFISYNQTNQTQTERTKIKKT